MSRTDRAHRPTQQPRQCPFCHGSNTGVIDAEEQWCGARVVACDACGAQGPHGISDESAVELWNGAAPQSLHR